MKKLILGILFILCLGVVMGTPAIVTNETINVGTETFTIHTATNATSLIKYSVWSGSSLIEKGTLTPNASESYITIGSLTGNTLYRWQVNYTNQAVNRKISNYVTTDDYIINSSGTRILIPLLIVVGLAIVISLILAGNFNAKDKLTAVIGVIIAGIIILGLLGA